MGLQSHLSDLSSESILILLVVLLGKTVSYLHSLLLTFLHTLGILSPRFDADRNHHLVASLNDAVGAGLANLIVLCDQLNLNRVCSYRNGGEDAEEEDADCVVCLSRFGEGDHVRRLACRHVFHKDCLDGWLDHLNFNCPLCRAPLASDEQFEHAKRRVTGDLLAWFPSQ